MAIAFLKNLGVDEMIIQALSKTYGDNLDGLWIGKKNDDLKLLVESCNNPEHLSHLMTIQCFFDKKAVSQVSEAGVEYTTERYNCRDKIVFLPVSNSGKANLEINGHKVKMGDSLFQILKYLAQELKKGKGGWVYVQDMIAAEVIPSDGYQPFSRLRSALAGYLLDRNPQDFIEANGRKQYRISTDPGNVSIVEKVEK